MLQGRLAFDGRPDLHAELWRTSATSWYEAVLAASAQQWASNAMALRRSLAIPGTQAIPARIDARNISMSKDCSAHISAVACIRRLAMSILNLDKLHMAPA